MQSIIKMALRPVLVMVVGFWVTGPAFSAPTGEIPSSLSEWENWVLYDRDAERCPTNYNDGGIHRCRWPSRLTLSVRGDGGKFEQHWRVFAKGWVPLPGNRSVWPDTTTIDGKIVPVIERNRRPHVHLTPGAYTVTGLFSWKKMPEMIQIPAESGLVTLFITDRRVENPHIDPKGRLWLQKQKTVETGENRINVRLFRLLDDTIPMRITTHLELEVSGTPREVKLEKILTGLGVPLRLKSPVPAKIGPGQELLLQVRPGRWLVRIETRVEGPVASLSAPDGPYGTEIWSFKPRNHLRMVEVTGAPTVEPGQTGMPGDWKKYPGYILKPGNAIAFREIRRGDPDPAPDRLSLHRTWWLDFNGRGYTVQDKISGAMSHQWFLSMNPPGRLGRVAVDGEDQLITRQGPDRKPGVELRRGKLKMEADSRFEASRREISAVGWDHDFTSVSGILNLPPGWRLLTAAGVDILPGTWLQQWTLLDIFLALIIALAVVKLKNGIWGVLALATMVLCFHEPGAPRIVWLHILGVLALLKLLSDGWFRRLVTVWGVVAVVFLLILSIPFMVQQVRWGIYPQLEKVHGGSLLEWSGIKKRYVLSGDVSTESPDEYIAQKPAPQKMKSRYDSKAAQMLMENRQMIFEQDPDAMIQTGPGVPAWNWRSFSMKWNGPVSKGQQVRLWLIPPAANLVLAFVRVILLALLIYGLIDMRYWWGKISRKASPAAAMFLVAAFLAISGAPDPAAADSSYPPTELLEELQTRLLKPPVCLPHCADISRMELVAEPARLQLRLEVHAEARTAVPLPVSLNSWSPEMVLLDEKPLEGLSRDADGMMWALVEAGVHTLVLAGKIGPGDVLQLPLPIRPHQGAFTGNGWDVKGIRADGSVDDSVLLTRRKSGQTGAGTYNAGTFAPFLHIQRVFQLGLTWRITTTVTRLTPPGTPLLTSFPLMAGESVITDGFHTEDGMVQINLASNIKTVSFTSSVKMSEKIILTAPKAVPWTETWELDASPIWHCDLSGIPVIHHQDKEGLWRPEWKPWPGETVEIAVSRPKAIPGRMVTIDAADLTLTPGQRYSKSSLTIKIRSSRGGQQQITLPEKAGLQQVKVEGKSLPVRQDGRTVTVPLKPGRQTIFLEWQQATVSRIRLRAPDVKIGERAVNAEVTFNIPGNRWILFTGGPQLGPAVLFWSYLLVVALAAVALGRVDITPLKTRHWLLLGLGLTQVSPVMALIIIGWLLALGFRGKHVPPDRWFRFNLTQVVLVIWTLVALYGLYVSIEKGLLGIPDMQIDGNRSTDSVLHWTQDRIDGTMPQPWALLLPRWAYHVLMLFWSLWLAFSLLKWLKWGWRNFSEGKVWRKMDRKKTEKTAEGEKAVAPPLPTGRG